jgi:hypothetical protein
MQDKLELAVVDHPAQLVPMGDPAPGDLIKAALSSGATAETLERIMAMQERHEANEARKAYHAAMAAFKANPPRIHKDKLVSYGNTSYRHATLGNVVERVSDSLSVHGLSAAWRTEQDGLRVTVTCTVTHALGHSESTSLSGEPDASGQKNKIQQVGSTVTYLQRYTLLALLGLATHDDDAGATAPHPVSAADVANLLTDIEALGVDEAQFCQYLKVSTLEDLTEASLPRAKAALAQKRRAANKKGGAQ